MRYVNLAQAMVGALVVGGLSLAGPAVAGEEEDAIVKLLTDMTQASSNFPRTRDIDSVLQGYTSDYVEYANGEALTHADTRQALLHVKEMLELGADLGISARKEDIEAHVSGAFGWATYRSTVKIGQGGVVVETLERLCTALLRKEEGRWLVFHDHCSSEPKPCPEQSHTGGASGPSPESWGQIKITQPTDILNLAGQSIGQIAVGDRLEYFGFDEHFEHYKIRFRGQDAYIHLVHAEILLQ